MSKDIIWKKVVGQTRVKKALNTSVSTGSLGHAYLFAGEAGAGKFATALELAFALHCESDNNAPCYSCDSCRMILHNNSPEFNMVFPVELDKKEKKENEINEDGWEKISELIIDKINNPYTLTKHGKGTVPVDWIRVMTRSVNRGSLSGKINITVFLDIDTMSPSAANTMLKTLEEPPANTLLLLLTSRINSLLPTIRSRCQLIRFGSITENEIEVALASEFNLPNTDEKIKIAAQGALGYYGRARDIMLGEGDTEVQKTATNLLLYCIENGFDQDMPNRLEAINEALFEGGKEYSVAKEFYNSWLNILRTLFFKLTTDSENYIYTNSSINFDKIRLDVTKIEQISTLCESAIKDVGARCNTLLVLITFAMSVMEILNEQK